MSATSDYSVKKPRSAVCVLASRLLRLRVGFVSKTPARHFLPGIPTWNKRFLARGEQALESHLLNEYTNLSRGIGIKEDTEGPWAFIVARPYLFSRRIRKEEGRGERQRTRSRSQPGCEPGIITPASLGAKRGGGEVDAR